MREERFVINDRSWSIIEPLVPGTEAGSRSDGSQGTRRSRDASE
jgi:transposase